MGYDKQKVINIALAEEGYLEKKSNKDLDDKTANAGSANYTKFARDMDAIPGFYNGKSRPWRGAIFLWIGALCRHTALTQVVRSFVSR